jgi:hypothetical protein
MGRSRHPDSGSLQSKGCLNFSSNVRFSPESNRLVRRREMTRCANRDRVHRGNNLINFSCQFRRVAPHQGDEGAGVEATWADCVWAAVR